MMKSCCLILWFTVAVHLSRANLASDSVGTGSGKLIGGAVPPSTSLGSVYRTARDDYNAKTHCSNCGPGYGRDMRTYGRPGIVGYYSGMGPIEDDRNWYYRPEVLEDRNRGGSGYQTSFTGGYRQPGYMMGYEYDRYMNRPDDRGYGYGYAGMPVRTGYYDGGNSRMSSMSHHPEMMRGYGYRGNGYDNLDPHYQYYMTQRGGTGAHGVSNGDRYSGTQGYYDDRMGYGGQYDQKNFRPWDQTYSGISGFDNSGRGYYFASRPLTSSLPSSSPTSSPSYPAHASYHVQAQPAAAPSRFGGQGSDHNVPHRPGLPNTGGYRPEQQHHGNGRPDYQLSSEASPNCCRNRYPEPASHNSAAGGGSAYAGNGPTGPSGANYGGSGSVHRPSSSAGTWNYVSSGPPISAGSQHYVGGSGSSSSSVSDGSRPHGSYGEQHSGSGHYLAGNGPSAQESYGGNRGNEHHRDTDHRQQSTSYAGHPRPSSLSNNSYLMDRDSNSDRVSSESASEPTDDDATRAKPYISQENPYDESKDQKSSAKS